MYVIHSILQIGSNSNKHSVLNRQAATPVARHQNEANVKSSKQYATQISSHHHRYMEIKPASVLMKELTL
jgi:hypothetical protein